MSDQPRQCVTLGPECDLQGTLCLEGDTRFLGRFRGDLRVRGRLEIGGSAHLAGTIIAEQLYVAGRVEANITVEQGISLAAGASLQGEVRCAAFTAPPGATFQGQLVIAQPASAAPAIPVPTPSEESAVTPAPTPAPASATDNIEPVATTDDALPPADPAPTAEITTVPDVLHSVSLRRRTRVLGATGLRRD